MEITSGAAAVMVLVLNEKERLRRVVTRIGEGELGPDCSSRSWRWWCCRCCRQDATARGAASNRADCG